MEHLRTYAKTLEATAREQIVEIAAVYDTEIIRIMPDAHAGAGTVIGTVMAITDRINPDIVGVDIGCGMLVAKLKQKRNSTFDFDAFDKNLRKRIPSGFSARNKAIRDFDFSELKCKNSKDINFQRALQSIGTLGGGNHFIEIDKDSNGDFYIVIHSGSRNLGYQVARHYKNVMKKTQYKEQREAEVQAIVDEYKAAGKELRIQEALAPIFAKYKNSADYLMGDYFEDYLHDIKIIQEYASLNRRTMLELLLEASEMTIWQPEEVFETIHNYIEIVNPNSNNYNYLPNTVTGIVRKGVVRALEGERLIIPMNMRDGSLLCEGLGNPEWLSSAPHGAGRVMGRKEAKRTLSFDEYKKTMDGIYTTSVNEATIDEAPMAYKDMNEIKELIDGVSVNVIDVLKPVYNYKDVRK